MLETLTIIPEWLGTLAENIPGPTTKSNSKDVKKIKNLWAKTIENGLIVLSRLYDGVVQSRPPVVRILFSAMPNPDSAKQSANAKISQSRREEPKYFQLLKVSASNLPIVYTRIAHLVTHLNHAKIVAADEDWLLYGGINFYDFDYLVKAPVIDLSIRLNGAGIARLAQRFLDVQWVRNNISFSAEQM